jgi:hypothetical protein
MKLKKKINHWIQSGIIDHPTGIRILGFESAKSPQKRMLFALSGLGALAIGV